MTVGEDVWLVVLVAQPVADTATTKSNRRAPVVTDLTSIRVASSTLRI